MAATLFYVHDPMCSWCWAYRPAWQQLKQLLPSELLVEYVVGGLAPDSDEPMPVDLQEDIQGYWRKIQQQLGTEFNFDFWSKNTPRRSTYEACRAVIAADKQGYAEAMIEAIQRGYYLQARNPSDRDVLVAMAKEQELDVAVFLADLDEADTEIRLLDDIAMARRWKVPGFPSLVLLVGDQLHHIEVNYQDPQLTLQQITALLDD
ncbi:putative protein-disulfide isomerase [Sinobacterium caligoides]|uniref:DSBA-like thioredoxin domain-containing protein n=1 Tax=Sinobacterium caligoides TaxID=933926 RepID=A0A3N2DQH1_9GAMM|nr:DsbA family protein [Sinobacterium caligoides]ROS01922.1 putative protein-disulfide isomerase [Sinobacterium caligoides]